MRNEAITCLRCETPMQTGFILDYTYGSLVQSKWVEGLPVNAKFLGMDAGLDIKDRQTFPLVAYRCPQCSRVELFANDHDEAHDILLRPAGAGEEQASDQLLRGSEAPKNN